MSSTPIGFSDLPRYPMPREDPLDLPSELAQLAVTGPLTKVRLWDNNRVWLVTGWHEARTVLADNRFSADLSRAGFPHVRPGFRGIRAAPPRISDTGGATLLRMDPPEHDRLRRMLTSYFTVRQVGAMRPMVQDMTDACLDDLESRGTPADIIDALAVPLPSLVICELLGVPTADRAYFEKLTSTVLAADATQRQVIGALRRLVAYLEELVRAKEKEPGEDILSVLIRDYVSCGMLSHGDLVSTARLLLTAGHETTARMLGVCLVALLEHRSWWASLQSAPDRIPNAVEEMLRFHTIAHTGLARVAIEDVAIAGQVVREAEGVIVSLAAANRDPCVFADPNVVQLNRSARHHISFGFGIHQCLGQALARLELEVSLASVMRRFPGLRLAGSIGEVMFGHNQMIYGVQGLWVKW